MKITILGGGGFLGRKIASLLARTGTIGGKTVTGLTLFDLHEPPPLDAPFPVTRLAGDIVSLPDGAIPLGTNRQPQARSMLVPLIRSR